MRLSGTIVGLFVLLILANHAGAQPAVPERRFEVTPYGGVVWTGGYDVLLGAQKGKLDTKTSAMWGVAVDYKLKNFTELEVLYNRQDSEMGFNFSGNTTSIADVSVEYLQAGILFGAPRNDVLLFTSVSAGTTRVAPRDGGDDRWRFSIMLGLGAKYFFNERVGLRLQGRAPFIWVNDSSEFICGDAGCLKSGGGSGIWQYDLSLGLVVTL